MSQAGIISITASGGVTSLETDDGNIVSPAAGVIQVDGSIVANGTNAKPLFTDGATANTAIWELQVGTAVTGAPGDTNDAGIVSFDDTQFTVDADGFVQLISAGNFIDVVNVDFSTVPGTNPVLPDVSGDITITGNAVANATNANMPVASHSRAANSFTLEVQVGAAITGSPADNFDAGLVSLSDAYFSVDSNGFVEIIGDLAALEALGGVGFAVRSAADTWVQRSIAVTSSTGLSISNGNGVSGNPTLAGIDADTSTKGVVELATTAEVTTGTSTTLVPSVASMIGHEGIAKAWFSFDDGAGTILDSFNITSVTNSGAGIYDVVIATDFGGATYSVVATSSYEAGSGRPLWPVIPDTTYAAGTYTIQTFNMGAGGGTYTLIDTDYLFSIAIGDQ